VSEQSDQSFVSMINSVKDDLTSLVDSHIELARAEARESVGRIAKSSGLFITAIAILNLNTLGFELWVSFLFVVGGLTLGGVILGLFAMRQASKITFGTKTAKSVSNTVQTISSIRPGSK
jgi:Flp pilus assembly protein TadB